MSCVGVSKETVVYSDEGLTFETSVSYFTYFFTVLKLSFYTTVSILWIP